MSKNTAVAASPEAFELMEQRDEEQILAEIKGAILDEMFYSFPLDGRTVTGISWVGTKEIARRYGGIEMNFVKVEETDTHYVAIVKATDTRSGTSLLGTSMQSKLMKVKGAEKPDRFAYTKAVSKAQRNAIRAIIPERFLIEMYEVFKKGKAGRKGKQSRRQVEAKSTVLDDVQDVAQPTQVVLDDPIGSAEDDPAVAQVVALLQEQDLRTSNMILVKKDGAVWIQHVDGLTQDTFNNYNDVINGKLGGKYHMDLRAWEVKP